MQGVLSCLMAEWFERVPEGPRLHLVDGLEKCSHSKSVGPFLCDKIHLFILQFQLRRNDEAIRAKYREVKIR